jgi:hypothetical protein
MRATRKELCHPKMTAETPEMIGQMQSNKVARKPTLKRNPKSIQTVLQRNWLTASTQRSGRYLPAPLLNEEIETSIPSPFIALERKWQQY